MRKVVMLVLMLMVCLTVAMPAFAQGAETCSSYGHELGCHHFRFSRWPWPSLWLLWDSQRFAAAGL